MTVVEVLLAANLVVFTVCAVRASRPASPQIDDLLRAALGTVRAAAPIPTEPVGNVVPFRARQDVHHLHTRSLHPSSQP